MPHRTGPTCGNAQARTSANRRGNSDGIRKTTRNRQAPNRYGQPNTADRTSPTTDETVTQENEDGESEASEYGNQAPAAHEPSSSQYKPQTTESLLSEIPVIQSRPETPSGRHHLAPESITLDDMRELLRAHEEDIVNQVVQQLRPTHTPAISASPNLIQSSPNHPRQPWQETVAQLWISELQNELAQLQAEGDRVTRLGQGGRGLGIYDINPTQDTMRI